MSTDPGFGGPRREWRSTRRDSRITGRLFFGALLVTLGLLWTLDNLGLANASEYMRWWPVIPMAYGLLRLSGIDGTRRIGSGLLFTLGGGYMLLHEVGFLSLSLFGLWPVFLIVIGGSLVWRSFRTPPAGGLSGDASTYPRPFAFMGGISRAIDSQDLVGLEATAVMGGIDADLRGARARGGEVVVEVFAWWGGIELYVPDTWRVVSEVMPIMGGVEDRTRLAEGGGATTLVVRGLVVMGGLEIRNEKGSERGFRGVKVGVISEMRGGRRKEVRVDTGGITVTQPGKQVRIETGGVTITRDDAPPSPPPSSPPPPPQS
jgi:hypothetical protein